MIVDTGHARNPDFLRTSQHIPLLREPLTEATFVLVLGVLTGGGHCPASDFFSGLK
jgi:hypothetical protein